MSPQHPLKGYRKSLILTWPSQKPAQVVCLSLWCYPSLGIGLMLEVTGAPELAQRRWAMGEAGIIWCWRAQHQAREGSSPSISDTIMEHTKLCPRAVSHRFRGPSVILAYSALHLHFPSGFGTALLSFRFAAVSLSMFCSLVPPFPWQEEAQVSLALQWQWEEGEWSESACRGSSLHRALIAHLSAFKSTYFPYQGAGLSHFISLHLWLKASI